VDKKPKVEVEQPATIPYNETVKLQSLLDARILYIGQVTQRHYEWNRAGSIVAVDAADAPSLLSKRIKSQSCCNGSDNAVFQIVE
jgi:hypothetical protein